MSTRKRNLAVVERYLLVTTQGDLSELPDLVHSRVKGFDGEDRVSGLSKLRAYFEGMRSGLTGIRFTVEITACDGEWVAVCGKMKGSHTGPLMGMPATGAKFAVPGSAFFRLIDGKISDIRSFWDLAAFLKQTALPPSAAASLKRTP